MNEPGRLVVKEVHIDAAPETVFEFFVDADRLTRWLATSATLEPRPGGACRQVHRGGADRGGRTFHMEGRFIEIETPTRVVFSWGFAEPDIGIAPGSSIVEVTLHTAGSGTRLRLVHRCLPAAEIPNHVQGWTEMLKRLAAAAEQPALPGTGARENRVKSIDHEFWIKAGPPTVFEAITSREGLDAWWGKAVTAQPEVGSVVEFDHSLGGPLRMRIVSLTPARSVTWRCVSDFSDPDNPASEWLGHHLDFPIRPGPDDTTPQWLQDRLRMSPGEGFTVLDFRHAGWHDDARWFGFCNSGWAAVLTALQRYCDSGGHVRDIN